MLATETLAAFVGLLAGEAHAAAATVTQHVALALNDPEAYYKQFADDLDERGIEELPPERTDLAQLVVVHELEKAGLLAEIDWKSTAEDAVWSINNVLIKQGRPVLADLGADGLEDPEAMLTRVGQALSLRNLTLVYVDQDSDSYPLAVATSATVPRLRELALHLTTY